MTEDALKELTGLPVGDYVVTETVTDENGYSYTATYTLSSTDDGVEAVETTAYPDDGIEAPVTKDETTTVNLTNAYELGNLEITKTITDYPGETAPVIEFTVTGDNNFSKTFTLAADFTAPETVNGT